MARRMNPSSEKIPEARRAYERGESMLSISRRFSIRRQTLMKIRDRECWIVDPSAQRDERVCAEEAQAVRKRVTAQVIDIATRQALEKPETVVAIDDLAEALRRQSALASKLMTLTENLVDAVSSGEVEPAFHSSRATLIAETVSAAERAQAFARTAAGLKAGESSELRDKAKTLQRRFTVVEAPPPETKAKAAS